MNLNRDLDIIMSICESLTDDDGLYDELDDKNEYKHEEYQGPRGAGYLSAGDIVLLRWAVGIDYDEYEYSILNKDGDQLDLGFHNALAHIIDNSDEIRNYALEYVIKIIEFYQDLRDVDEIDSSYHGFIRTYDLLKNKQMQSNPEMTSYLDIDRIFELFGNIEQ